MPLPIFAGRDSRTGTAPAPNDHPRFGDFGHMGDTSHLAVTAIPEESDHASPKAKDVAFTYTHTP